MSQVESFLHKIRLRTSFYTLCCALCCIHVIPFGWISRSFFVMLASYFVGVLVSYQAFLMIVRSL